MAVNKNFVVKNGLEVNTKLILADAETNKVGIGSTAPRFELEVAGGIGATDIYVTGISTVLNTFNVGLDGKVLSVTGGTGGISTSLVGVGTANPVYLLDVRSPVSTGQTALYVQGDVKITGDLLVDDLNFDQATLTDLNVTGIATVGKLGVTGLTTTQYLQVTGISTFNDEVYFDGVTTFANYAQFLDNQSAYFGNGADLNIYHDGSNSVIQEQGQGNLYIQSDNGSVNIRTSSTENAFVANQDGSVELYYDNAKKFETLGAGATVTGTLFTNQLSVSGITTIYDTTDSTTFNNGALVIEGGLGVEKSVNIGGNLDVTGNISIAGSFFSLQSQDVYIANKDIILGFTTNPTPNDDTANHAGIAIASTEGFPLVSFSVSGINTLPDTYKQLMWFRSGTLGFSTDIFGLNYGLAIGTTTVANGVRFAVGSDITATDTEINVGNLRVSSGIITATSGIVTYYGDGSYLTGNARNLTATIGIRTEGSVLGYGISFLDLRGAGVSTTYYDSTVGIATIYFQGGGGGSASIGIGSTPGEAFAGIITAGNLWYNNNLGRLFIYYQDDDSAQWVDASPFNVGVITSLSNVSFYPGSSTNPSLYFLGDSQTGFFSPSSGQFTVVSSGSSVLNVNSSGISVSGIASVGTGITMYGSAGIVSATSFYGDGSNLTNTGSTLSAASGSQRVVVTSQTSGTMTASATDADLAFNAGTNTLSVSDIQISPGIVTTTANSFELYKPVLSNYSEKINTIGNTGASCNINLANGAYVIATLDQTTTFTFTTGITTGAIGFALQLTNGTGGPYSITWPVSVKWPNNSIPIRTTADNKTDVWVFNTTDNGTTWYGNLALYNFS